MDPGKRPTCWSVWTLQRTYRGSQQVIVQIHRLTRGSLWKSQPDESAATPDEAEIGWKLANMNSASIFLSLLLFFFYSFTPFPCVKSKLFSSHLLPSLKFDTSGGCVPHSDWHRAAERAPLLPPSLPTISFLFGGESDSLLPRDSAAVMCSFRLACQPPFN